MNDDEQAELRAQMDAALAQGKGPAVARFALACLGGIPIAGGAFGAGASAWSEGEQKRINGIFGEWMKLQEAELEEISRTLFEVLIRLDPEDERVTERVSSQEFLSLVRKCFRDWSAAESEDKRVLMRNLLANAASCELTTDDVVRLFIEWIGSYSELHFKVIACVYSNRGITRFGMWQELHGEEVREDSAEADLFKLVVHDLSIGHVIRQHREVDAYGNFVRRQTRKRKASSSRLTSAFDNEKPYVLTSLGTQFVHYTMNELVPKIGPGSEADA